MFNRHKLRFMKLHYACSLNSRWCHFYTLVLSLYCLAPAWMLYEWLCHRRPYSLGILYLMYEILDEISHTQTTYNSYADIAGFQNQIWPLIDVSSHLSQETRDHTWVDIIFLWYFPTKLKKMKVLFFKLLTVQLCLNYLHKTVK